MKVTALHIEMHRTTPSLIIFLEQHAPCCLWVSPVVCFTVLATDSILLLTFFFIDANCRTIYFLRFGSVITDDARTHLSDAKSPIHHIIWSRTSHFNLRTILSAKAKESDTAFINSLLLLLISTIWGLTCTCWWKSWSTSLRARLGTFG